MTHQHCHPMTRSTPTQRAVRGLPAAALVMAARWTALVIACGIVQPTAAGVATDRIAVAELKPLLILAVERGESHGTLSGTGAAYAQRRFDTANPVEIDVLRVRALHQSGCSRLEVTTHQRAVLVDGQRQDQRLVYQLSFCADGRLLEEK
jgi:hypothetical protein